MSRMGKLLGVEWGEDADRVGAGLGLACKGWQDWAGGQGFEVCYDFEGTLGVLGKDAHVGLVRAERELHGLELTFADCKRDWTELREAVREKLDLLETETNDLYQVCRDGEVVRFVPSGDGCKLVLASPRFGKVYKDYLLKTGFEEIVSSILGH